MPLVDAARLTRFVGSIFAAVNVPEADASLVAEHLVAADISGVGTHGVARVATYVEKIESGEVNARPAPTSRRVAPALLAVEADGALGAVACYPALERLIELTRESGLAAAVVSNVGHLGALRTYLSYDGLSDEAVLLSQYTVPSMALPGSARALIGTNPFAFRFPGGSAAPIVVDMSCSVAARGKIIDAAREGRELPDGWAVDADGQPTTDPKAALAGSLLPLGGYKGFALALFGELFAGILSNAFDRAHDRPGSDGVRTASSAIGAFIVVVDATRFVPESALDERVDRWRAGFDARAGPDIHVPGRASKGLRAKNVARDVSVESSVLATLATLARRLGVPSTL